MNISDLLWASGPLSSLGVGYTARFSGATLALGRALSSTGEGRGFQDAVTPRWETNLACLSYGVAGASVAVSWYLFGIGRAGTMFGCLAIGTFLLSQVLPKSNSAHYLKSIVESMARRHANFVRDGDMMRAEAMQDLRRRLEAYFDAGGGEADWIGWTARERQGR
jgi:hypothetical protein